MKPRGTRQYDLADAIAMAESNLSSGIYGRRDISPGMAWELAQTLGTTPRYWMDLQSDYELWRVRPRRPGRKGSRKPQRR